jgi:hypothetical protein
MTADGIPFSLGLPVQTCTTTLLREVSQQSNDGLACISQTTEQRAVRRPRRCAIRRNVTPENQQMANWKNYAEEATLNLYQRDDALLHRTPPCRDDTLEAIHCALFSEQGIKTRGDCHSRLEHSTASRNAVRLESCN